MQKCFKVSKLSVRVNLELIYTMAAFPYLGSTVAFNNSNWAALYGNLRKAQRRWGVLAKVMMKM